MADMKTFFKKLNRKMPDYIIYLVGFGMMGPCAYHLLISASLLSFILGIAMTVFLLISAFVLGVREILYWIKKDEPDGWEDDLTNQG